MAIATTDLRGIQMATTTTRSRARLALVATLAGGLVAGAAGTTPALGAPTSSVTDPRPELLRAFAAASTSGSDPTATPLGGDRAKAVEVADKTPLTIAPGERGPAATTAPRRSAAAATGDCASLNASVVQTLDRTHVIWDTVPGATSFSVSRQRYGGSARTLRSGLTGDTTSFLDAGHDPMGSAAWYVNATVGTSTFSCRTPESGWWSMSTPDGTGWPDVFFAGDDQVFEQDVFGPAFPAWDASLTRPSFSPNGHQLAAVETIGGVPSISVRVSATGQLLWSVPFPAGTVLDEPAFAPDGQKIVVEALNPTDLSTSTGLYTIPVWTKHTPRLIPGSAGLATPDWVDTPGATSSTTVVAADLSPGGGLVLVNATSGARTPLARTGGAIDPTGLPDGSILFGTNSASTATISLRTSAGAVSILGQYADSEVRWPVLSPDGDIYHFIRYPDPDRPGSHLWAVDRLDSSGVGSPSWVGGTWDGSSPGFQGFDLRTPFSAGTSDVGGSPNPDILARSSSGVLYGYPLSGDGARFFDSRQKIGTGWNVMKQFLAVGDLNGDRHGDILAVDRYGSLWFYPGRGDYKVGARTRVGTGWQSYNIFSTGDFDGDSRADIIARDRYGRLWIYPGNGRGGVLPRKQIGSGWQIFNAILGPGDWDYDGKPDLIARDRASGTLYLYPGKGNGGFGARKVLGRGWNARVGFAATEVWGGLNALFATTTDGTLLDYDSVGDGVMLGSDIYVAGTGWSSYTITG